MFVYPSNPDQARGSISRLFRFYVMALAVLFASVLGSVILTEMEAAQIAEDASRINMSGRQRMLSQRIIYLAVELQQVSPEQRRETATQLATAIDQFESAIELFANSHSVLTDNPALSPTIRELYFSSNGPPSLDARVRAYIDTARRILDEPQNAVLLERLKGIERAGLLADLDTIVTAFEGESIAKIDRLRFMELLSLGVALAIILCELIFVFLPGHRLLRKSFDALDQQKNALAQTNASLVQSTTRLAEETRQLDAALEESEEMRREQAEFTYAVSHDLKSPANTIRLLLNEMSLLEQSRPHPDARTLIDHAQGAVNRMSQLITDVLSYSMATHEKAAYSDVDIEALVAGVRADLAADLTHSGAVLEITASGQMKGHQQQLRLLVQNLLTNAIKYCESGAVPHVKLEFMPAEDGQCHILRVTDKGIGIAAEDQARIFGLFQRLHVQEDYPGTGLGLATCQRIAASHGGHINVTSTPGEGSIFEVILPCPECMANPNKPQDTSNEDAPQRKAAA